MSNNKHENNDADFSISDSISYLENKEESDSEVEQ